MAKGIQGHVIELNLSELNSREKDRNSIDNLGGEGMADDLSLFINNLKNTSIIKKEIYSVIDVTIDGSLQPVIKINDPFTVPFSNRTTVKCGAVDCIVVNSNTTDQFQLKRKDNNQIFNPGLVDIIRYDSVFTQNFDNINPLRFPPTKTENYTGVSLSIEADSYDIYDVSIPSYIDYIDSSIDSFLYLKSNSILTYQNNSFTKAVNLSDSIVIRNLDSNGNPITVQNSLTNDDPGVFIVSGNARFRAFSDNSNPWNIDTPNYTSTISNKTAMSELEVTNPIITGLTIITETGSIPNTFNAVADNVYYLPVYINGELYNLLSVKQ